jgi:hypothetical protein
MPQLSPFAQYQVARDGGDPARIDALPQATAIVQIALINKRGCLQAIAWDHANVRIFEQHM